MCTTTPGCGRSASTRIEPASTEPAAKRSRSTARWSSPLSSGSTTVGSTAMRSSAGVRPAALVATISASTGSCSRATRARAGDELAEAHALHAQAALGDHRGGRLARDDHDLGARPLEHAGQQPAHPAGAEHGDSHGSGSISTPGFMMPAGSTAALAPRSAAANGVGPLAVIPGPMVAPDGVVVGDGPALGEDRVGGGALDRRPLLDLLARAARARAP